MNRFLRRACAPCWLWLVFAGGWVLGSPPWGNLGSALGQTVGAGSTRPIEGIGDRRPELYALQNARVVTGPGQVIADATVLISGQSITAVGADIALPPGTQLIPMSGKTIYAGLIDLGGEAAASRVPRGGTAHWNPYVTPENSPDLRPAAEEPIADAAALRSQGVTVRLMAPAGGIFSGSSHAVLTGGPPSLAPVLRHEVAQHLQLTVPRGAPRDTFPKSPMGAMALVRQTMLDATWHQQAMQAHQNDRRTSSPEADLVLQQIAGAMRSQSFIIDCPNERFIGRADALAREFSIAVVLKGSGREYRLLDTVAATGRTLLVPVSFPKPPEVATVQDADDVPLTDLMHWHLAPENPSRLASAGVRFALTTAGLDKPGEFLAAVRQAVRRGLAPETALAALTTIPAEILQLEGRLGTIQAGMLANLIVVDGDLFDDDAAVVETWVAGRRYRHPAGALSSDAVQPLSGTWSLRLRPAKNKIDRVEMIFSRPATKPGEKPKPADKAKLEGKLIIAARAKDKQASSPQAFATLANLTPQRDRLTATFDAEQLDPKLPSGVARLSLLVTRTAAEQDGGGEGLAASAIQLSGEIVWPDASTTQLSVQRKAGTASAETPDENVDKPGDDSEPAAELLTDCPINCPLGACGVDALPPQPQAVLLRGGTLWTCGPQGVLDNTDVLVRNGKIVEVGRDLQRPKNCQIVDAKGMHLTPGMIDCHSHIATDGGVNEASRAVTADVRIGDFIDHTDITIYRHLAGGVTTSNILHGSANPIGGQNQVIKLRWGAEPEGLRFEAAPPGIKFALGENVKREQWRDGSSPRYPQSRMGVEQLLRDQFIAARQYDQAWRNWQSGKRSGLPPRRDLRLEAIAEVLRGERWVHCHSYRQDEISALLNIFQEFNVQIGTLQHVLEGYKVAEVLAEHQAMASTFADWWAYKIEVYDAIPYNAAVLQRRGVVVSMNSDDRELGRHLNTEAAKAVKYGGISDSEALMMVTLNPAKQLRIDQWVGSIELGKDADLVLWSGPPLSTLSRCEQTWIDGRLYFSRGSDAEARVKNEQLRAKLIQLVLAKDDKKKSPPTPGEKSDSPDSLALIDEEARWPREDLYCSARSGGVSRNSSDADIQQPSAAMPSQP